MNRPVRLALLLSAAALVYGNTVSPLLDEANRWVATSVNLGAAGVALLIVVRQGFGLRELGLRLALPRAASHALAGVAVGVALAAPGAIAIGLVALLLDDRIVDDEVSAGEPLGFVSSLIWLLVGTALPEELFFRSALLAVWRRVGGTRTALLATATLFALWHGVVAAETVGAQELGGRPAAPAAVYALVLLGLGFAGIVFAALRVRFMVVAPVAAHWGAVAALRAAIKLAG